MNEKLCIFCKHFKQEAIYAHEGCPTCGNMEYDGGATCLRGHYREQRPGGNGELHALYATAEKCKDYERP